jgi:archaellum component FlaC
MAKIDGEFTIKIPGTKDLKPPDLVCKWSAEFEGEPDYEKALLAHFKSSYEGGLKKVMEAQTKGFALPLASMQKDIDGMTKDLEAIYDLMEPAAVIKAFAAFKAKYPKGLDAQIDEYNKYLAEAVDNVKNQQLAIYAKKYEVEALAAAQKAVKRDLRNKKIRHIVGVVLRGALVLTIAAAAIASVVLTFGATAVIFAAFGAAAAGLGGISALGKTGKSIFDIRNLEQRSMGLLTQDLDDVATQLGKSEGKVKGLSKHIGDVSQYYTERKNKTNELHGELKKLGESLGKLRSEVDKLKNTAPKLSKLHAKQNAKLQTAEKAYQVSRDKFLASAKRDAEIKDLLDKAKVLVGDLNKIPFQGSKSVLDGLKKFKPSSADDVFSAVDTLSSLTGAVGGVGAGATS